MEDKIRVVVTGEFASGKSTLLNVLLGGEAMEKRLLPDTITIVGIPRRIVNGRVPKKGVGSVFAGRISASRVSGVILLPAERSVI